ncbi:carbohydrate-binding protein [Flavobacterium jejuense]|uniref:Carbohydrate-binding protein n=1 Tax=Flavobacterium jejuense TaxID=1544455 RepID=A0ABX0ILW1_9FLAO|nr:beta-1,3-glucanase family protein [Flavobacterium jejuense]NHN24809.1 carbohydrate-binding protein [Flavobacterium jejuense]
MKQTKQFIARGWKLSFFLLISIIGYSQGPIPFEIKNNSTFNDSELYVAIVGINYNTNQHVWVNPKTSQVLPMSPSYNTVTGPTIGGNTGPGQNSKYANCFAKLSEIPNKTFTLPQIAGCRVFIAKGQQLYFYFFGASGAPSGYTSPNPLNATDPNQGILYEIIELTNNQYGFFGNPSRVDSYKYPMGLELIGANGYQKKVGELKSHSQIVADFKANVPAEFQGCVNNATGEITAPSKTPAFADGTGGTSVGPYANYLKSYIDAIWNKYKNQDLIFYAGDAGVFKGRIYGEQLEVVGQSGGFTGRTGRVQNRPSTQEALEGKGVLDRRLVDGDLDLVIQAQLTAAINRHMVDVISANPGQQNWYNSAQFYQANPTNHYSKFWHLPGISVDNLSYGFAYDDVADQSPSLHSPQPTKVIATFGGYYGINTSTGVATVYKDCNYGGYAVNLPAGNYTLSQLQSRGILDNDISSLKVQSGYEMVLYANDNFTGTSIIVNSNDTCLVDNNFNDVATSLRVRTVTNSSSVLIQAEDYSAMNGIQTEPTTDSGGGLNVGYADTGDWMAYNSINFPTTGSYLIEYRVASAVNGAVISSDLNAGAIVLGNVNIPNTGGWQNWQTVSQTVSVNAGTYNFGIFIQNSGVNLNWIRITKVNNALKMTSTNTEEVFTLYPNPAENTLSFTVDIDDYKIQIIDFQRGMYLKVPKSNGRSLDVSSLKPGIYSIMLDKDGKKIERKFIKK